MAWPGLLRVPFQAQSVSHKVNKTGLCCQNAPATLRYCHDYYDYYQNNFFLLLVLNCRRADLRKNVGWQKTAAAGIVNFQAKNSQEQELQYIQSICGSNEQCWHTVVCCTFSTRQSRCTHAAQFRSAPPTAGCASRRKKEGSAYLSTQQSAHSLTPPPDLVGRQSQMSG